jgi:hypothetical protein
MRAGQQPAFRRTRLLLLSLITLFAGPLLYQWMSDAHLLARRLETLIVVVLVALVILLLVPDVLEPLGPGAVGLILVGYLLPGVLEKLVKRAAEGLHVASLILALIGLMLHALLDGAGLAGSELHADSGLAAAIILHRFGVGLMLWLIMRPAFGARAAWLTLFAIAAVTIIGFEFSERFLPFAGDGLIASVQGVIIGTIIHSLIHRGHVHPHREEADGPSPGDHSASKSRDHTKEH